MRRSFVILIAGALWVLGAGGSSPAGASGDGAGRLPTLFLIGDSTVHNRTRGQQGWGQALPPYFDPAKIRVENRARGGRSSRTFLTEGLWEAVRTTLKPGDFVLMQFGHNDGGSLSRNPSRASLKGVGEETQEATDPASGKKEEVHTYGWYLRKYIADVKAQGAVPIVLSPVPRNIWKDGRVARASGDYGRWAREAARAGGALFIDLNEAVAREYEAAGAEKVQAEYFGATDHTHTTPAGAKVNAAVVAAEIRKLEGSPLRGYLAPAAEAAAQCDGGVDVGENSGGETRTLDNAGMNRVL